MPDRHPIAQVRKNSDWSGCFAPMAQIRHLLRFCISVNSPPICYSSAHTDNLLHPTATPADFPRDHQPFPTVHSRASLDRFTPEVDSCPPHSLHQPPRPAPPATPRTPPRPLAPQRSPQIPPPRPLPHNLWPLTPGPPFSSPPAASHSGHSPPADSGIPISGITSTTANTCCKLRPIPSPNPCCHSPPGSAWSISPGSPRSA